MSQFRDLLETIMRVPELREMVDAAARAQVLALEAEVDSLKVELKKAHYERNDVCYTCHRRDDHDIPVMINSQNKNIGIYSIRDYADRTGYKILFNVELDRTYTIERVSDNDSAFRLPSRIFTLEGVHISGYSYSLRCDNGITDIRVRPPMSLEPIKFYKLRNHPDNHYLVIHDAQIEKLTITASVFPNSWCKNYVSNKYDFSRDVDTLEYSDDVIVRRSASAIISRVDQSRGHH
jgi:hypothetical protein